MVLGENDSNRSSKNAMRVETLSHSGRKPFFLMRLANPRVMCATTKRQLPYARTTKDSCPFDV